MNKVSTTQLAKKFNESSKELFQKLSQGGYVLREDDNWVLTDLGREAGGDVKSSSRFGNYIVWPEDLNLHKTESISEELYTSTNISKAFGTSANKVNQILAEIGLTKKHIKGWVLTEHGVQVGGVQHEHKQSGVPFVKWKKSFLDLKIIKETFASYTGSSADVDVAEQSKPDPNDFRSKFPAKYRSMDGHFLRSKAEVLIDNWLYMSGVVHAYERKLPVDEDVYCDFYLPNGKVYIEYWGLEEKQQYAERKAIKLDIYKKYNYNLIELTEHEVESLDDHMPRLLLKYGIQTD